MLDILPNTPLDDVMDLALGDAEFFGNRSRARCLSSFANREDLIDAESGLPMANADRISLFADHVPNILDAGPWCKVGGVAARRVIANDVTNHVSCRNWTNGQFVGHAMRASSAALDRELPVALTIPSPHIRPARIRPAASIDLRPKPRGKFLRCFVLFARHGAVDTDPVSHDGWHDEEDLSASAAGALDLGTLGRHRNCLPSRDEEGAEPGATAIAARRNHAVVPPIIADWRVQP
jgi:hypothetical protein